MRRATRLHDRTGAADAQPVTARVGALQGAAAPISVAMMIAMMEHLARNSNLGTLLAAPKYPNIDLINIMTCYPANTYRESLPWQR